MQHVLRADACRVSTAPILGLLGVMSGSAILLTNRHGHVWLEFDPGLWPILLPPLNCRGCSLLQHLLDVVFGDDDQPPWIYVWLREAILAHRGLDKNLQRLLHSLSDRHLRGVVGSIPFVLMVRGL